MTEDEAKTKWCPFARVLAHTSAQDGQGRSYEGGYSYNRQPDDAADFVPAHSFCIGSACMAWRSDEQWNQRTGLNEVVAFCGLGGRPS